MATNIFDLTGRVAFVTGGNGGIGLGIAKGLGEAGANIVIAARDQTKTAGAIAELENMGMDVIGLSIDVADESLVSSAVGMAIDRFGRIDILVNNAGIGIRKLPQEYTAAEWDRVVEVNLKGAFLCSREIYPHMVNVRGGKIINIGSMNSLFGSSWAASYAASKGGVVQFTKSLAVSWAKDNIQANAILPGWIQTDLTADIKRDWQDRYDTINSRIPQGKWGEPSDLAGAAVFLASRASNYLTGVALPVDGGYSAS